VNKLENRSGNVGSRVKPAMPLDASQMPVRESLASCYPTQPPSLKRMESQFWAVWR